MTDDQTATAPVVPHNAIPSFDHPGQAKPLQKLIGRLMKAPKPLKTVRHTGIKKNVVHVSVRTGKFY